MIKCNILLSLYIFIIIFVVSNITSYLYKNNNQDTNKQDTNKQDTNKQDTNKQDTNKQDSKNTIKFYNNKYFIYFLNSLITMIIIYLLYDKIINSNICDTNCLINNMVVINDKF
jgi:hypothetical protein